MEPGYQLLAAKYMRRQAKQLAEQLDGVRAAEDTEFVHRARVATRRLQTALAMFRKCFARKKVRRWREAICRITAGLGDARDRDVQVETICGILTTLHAKECLPGISRLLVQLERRRERLQPKVLRAIDRLQAQGVLREIQRVTKRRLRKLAVAMDDQPTPSIHLRTAKHILRQRDALLQFEGSLADPTDYEQHHVMRIVAKGFRYTLEIARPVYHGQLDAILDVVKKLQAYLGDLHDCDVWQEHLNRFTEGERRRSMSLYGHAGRFARLQPGVAYLQQNRLEHRRATYEQLVAFWRELRERQFWEDLAATVLTCPPPSPPTAETPLEPNLDHLATD